MKIPRVRSFLTRVWLLIYALFAFSNFGWAQNILIEEAQNSVQDLSNIQPDQVILWEGLEAQSHKNGHLIIVSLRLATKNGFTIYKDKLSFIPPSGGEIIRVQEPKALMQYDPISRQDVEVFNEGTFEVGIFLSQNWQGQEIPLKVRFVGCTQVICLFPHTKELTLRTYQSQMPLSDAWLAALPDSLKAKDSSTIQQNSPSSSSLSSVTKLEDFLGSHLNLAASFWLILLISFLGGLLTNVTPCVYPMIPITLRILGHYSKRPIRAACTYAFGIFLTYGALGIFAALSGAFFGSLMQSTFFNMIFACLMLFLAMSMLGFGSFYRLQQLGQRFSKHEKGLKGAFFMGLGAGFVAAPCTGPILAALMSLAASGLTAPQTILMMSTYSLGFAIPYVALGASTGAFHRVKLGMRSQTFVKVLFSGMMFALVFYYLRVPFYSYFKTFPWETALNYTLPFLSAALIILFVSQKSLLQKTFLMLPSFLMGFCLFAWVQIFVESATEISRKELTWHQRPDEVFSEAKKQKSPVLIDMWAEWCESCKKMEVTTFSDASVISYLKGKKWVLGKYDLTASTDWTDQIQQTYKLQGLPALVIIADPNQPERFEVVSGFLSPEQLLSHLKHYTGD